MEISRGWEKEERDTLRWSCHLHGFGLLATHEILLGVWGQVY
jgi:hypothetical protein